MIVAVPSWLYKYTTAERALQTLRDGEVYFAARCELNDPFDGRVTPDLSTSDKREYYLQQLNQRVAQWKQRGYNSRDTTTLDAAKRESIHKQFVEDPNFANNYVQKIWKNMDADNIGVYCLTEACDSLSMWAHYALNHSGCCLEFDLREHVRKDGYHKKLCFPLTFLEMVRYSPKYPLDALGANMSPLNPESAFLTKSTEWKNEKEWRAIMFDSRVITLDSEKPLSDLSRDESMFSRMKGAGLYKMDEGILRGVILGFKMERGCKADITAAARECGARVYQAKPKTFEFGLDITLVQDKPGNSA